MISKSSSANKRGSHAVRTPDRYSTNSFHFVTSNVSNGKRAILTFDSNHKVGRIQGDQQLNLMGYVWCFDSVNERFVRRQLEWGPVGREFGEGVPVCRGRIRLETEAKRCIHTSQQRSPHVARLSPSRAADEYVLFSHKTELWFQISRSRFLSYCQDLFKSNKTTISC